MTPTRVLLHKVVPTLTEVVELNDPVYVHGPAIPSGPPVPGQGETGERESASWPDLATDDAANRGQPVAADTDMPDPAVEANETKETNEDICSDALGNNEANTLDFLMTPPLAQGTAVDGVSGAQGGFFAATQVQGLAISEEQVVQRVLQDLQRQIDTMLEYRLREALAPSLSKMAETLVRDVRVDVAATLRDVVARAVTQELSRHRNR